MKIASFLRDGQPGYGIVDGDSIRPPRFLVAGDLLEIEVSGIGTLTNPVGTS